MLLTGICIGKIQAQNDPVLAGMILLYTDKAQKELKNQEKVMMLLRRTDLWLLSRNLKADRQYGRFYQAG